MQKTIIDPNMLIFREAVQNRLDDVAARFAGNDYPAITAVDHHIIDGHNRAAVAMGRGHNIMVINLTQDEYNHLQGLGYDDIEISYAALTAADEIDAALAYIDQFAGSNIFNRGEQSYGELMSYLTDKIK